MVGRVKRYGQVCPLARALDVVGERWSLLVVRELSLGPKRYRDLQDGLPGVPTNLLSTRLKDLQTAGVVVKRTLPPPTAVTVYELTEAGHALRPAISDLREWGRRYGPPAAETDEVRPSWALLSASGRATKLPDGRVCELRVDGEHFSLGAEQSRLTVHGGLAQAPDAIVILTAETLYDLLSGDAAVAEQSTIAGERRIARAALETLHAGQ
jgi:DNA-binding HxlR family transcriptional regulator